MYFLYHFLLAYIFYAKYFQLIFHLNKLIHKFSHISHNWKFIQHSAKAISNANFKHDTMHSASKMNILPNLKRTENALRQLAKEAARHFHTPKKCGNSKKKDKHQTEEPILCIC